MPDFKTIVIQKILKIQIESRKNEQLESDIRFYIKPRNFKSLFTNITNINE